MPSFLDVSFTVDPEVGESPPKLVVSLRSVYTKPVLVTVFSDPRCFAFYHLDLKISRKGKRVALAPCTVKDFPGTEFGLEHGSVFRIELPLTELAAKWPLGTYEIDVRHDPSKLDAATGTAHPRALQSSLNVQSFTIARPVKQFRINVGERVTLPDGVILEFTGHSHKSIHPGETSPLIANGMITRKGGQPEPFFAYLFPPQDRLFTVADDRVFELVDHAYGEWLELRYYGKLKRR